MKTSSALTDIKIKSTARAILRLQLLLRNQTTETMLIRPALDDWIIAENSIISTVNRIEPAYVCLLAGEATNQTIIVEIPPVQPGQILKSWLRFPGMQEEPILIQVEILTAAQGQDSNPIILPLLEIPLSGGSHDLLSRNATTGGIFGLISGLLDLDQIPCSCLVAELSVILAQQGKLYAQTPPGSELLQQLQRTRFFHNGVRAFSQASVANWIAKSLFTTNPGLEKGHLLDIWEQWLLSLVETDLESGELNQVFTPPLCSEAFTAKPTGDGDDLFAKIMLGLAVVSPRIAAILKVIAGDHVSSGGENQTTAASDTLSILSGLDTLAVRWLVLELLLILRQKGDKFAQTSQGSQLLCQLRRTRFFKNGVLALAAAQAPRWLAVSQSTAWAFHAKLGGEPGKQGLLYVWEQWLWSLHQPDWRASGVNLKSLPLTEALISEVAIDAEQWFTEIILGLGVVSPRIAAILKTIAAIAPISAVISQPQVFVEDVMSEGSSMQR